MDRMTYMHEFTLNTLHTTTRIKQWLLVPVWQHHMQWEIHKE